MKLKSTLALMAIAFSGCLAASPNLVFVQMPGVKAQGTIARHCEQLDLIEIAPRQLSEGQLGDLWIGFPGDKQIPLRSTTEASIKTLGATPAQRDVTPGISSTYYAGGYSLHFENGRLVSLTANRYGFPPKDGTAFARLGSLRNGNTLSLPCSLEQFENVFGKSGKITRGFAW